MKAEEIEKKLIELEAHLKAKIANLGPSEVARQAGLKWRQNIWSYRQGAVNWSIEKIIDVAKKLGL